jgi:hypothetical protein
MSTGEFNGFSGRKLYGRKKTRLKGAGSSPSTYFCCS